MRKIRCVYRVALCVTVMTTALLMYGSGSKTFGKEAESAHLSKSTPTRSLMQLISNHTSKILDAILVGDFNGVSREANAVAENSEIIMEMFFSADGKPGEWFKPDAENPKAAGEVKAEFEKYLKTVIDSARNIAESSRKKNIVETYKSLDEMLQKSCFACHEATREEWPNWPGFMRQAGG